MPHRRTLIAGLAAVGTVSLAGCTSLTVETDMECSIDRVFEGGACEIAATNNGPPMDVEIVLESRDADGNIVATRSRVISIGFRETRVINMNPTLEGDTEDLTVSTRRP